MNVPSFTSGLSQAASKSVLPVLVTFTPAASCLGPIYTMSLRGIVTTSISRSTTQFLTEPDEVCFPPGYLGTVYESDSLVTSCSVRMREVTFALPPAAQCPFGYTMLGFSVGERREVT